jgi:membrane associated rhomboid family serine protease
LKNKLAGRMSRLRPRVGFLAPGLGAGLFALIYSHQPLLDRCLSAVTVGVAIQVGTLIGAVLCMSLAAELTRQRAVVRLIHDDRDETALLGAMLLTTAMWMCWQIDREATVHDLASCVDQVTLDDPLRPSQAVNQCWRDRASRDAEDE